MRKIVDLYTWLFLAVSPITALAVPAGSELKYDASPFGIVTFSGEVHARQKIDCQGCHPKVFSLEHGVAVIRMSDHQEGKQFCFACHNGKVAFKPDNACDRCHKN